MPLRGTRVLFALFALALWNGRAHPQEHGRFTAVEENDYFAPHNRDRHNTQALELDYLSSEGASSDLDTAMAWLSSSLPAFEPGAQSTARRYNVFLGQALFTPQDKTRADPDPRDRPYAGWINGGVDFLSEADRRTLDRLRLQVGVIGPVAEGKATQNRTHLAIEAPIAQGWGHQLHDEPTVGLTFDRHWRFIADLNDAIAIDAIPAGRVELGNAFDYAALGGRVRFGQNLGADYGLPRVEPGPTGTTYFNAGALSPRSRFGWSLFIGAEGRAVGRNIFLDGNSFRRSASVSKNVLVGELEVGASAFYADWLRLSYTYAYRSPEFDGQRGGDSFGALTLSVILPF
ncbi:MAG: lipid A deacylase LpxR family protein [Alphaproteobacteria bacterium]